MIKITINGETRLFEPGMTVYDIIEEFDDNYTTDTCAVRVNDKRLSLEDEITEDCEMELLTFRDLGASRPVEQFSADQSENPFGNDDEVTQEDFEKYTMLAFHQMLDDGYLDVGNFETDYDEVSFELFNGFIEGMNGYSYRNVSDEAASDEIVSDEDTSEPVVLDGTVSDESVFDGTISDEEDDTDNALYASSDVGEPETGYSPNDADELTEDFEPESDGEFISVSSYGSGELSPDMLAAEENDSSDAVDATTSSVTETEDMQMHLGLPKIDDLVSELLVDIEPKDETSTYPEEDYSIDDNIMDAFLASQILPEKVVENDQNNNTIDGLIKDENLVLLDKSGKPWYEVDEDSIDDFVDYGEGSSSENDPYDSTNVSPALADKRRRRKKGVPVYIKVAALLVVLAGVGLLVSRIAIQVAGSPGAKEDINAKAPVSASDVSETDVTTPTSSEITTTSTSASETTTTVSTTAETTTTTTVTTTKATTAATTKATTTSRRTTRTTTTTATTTRRTSRKTKKTTKQTTEETTVSTTESTDASTTEGTTAGTTAGTTSGTTSDTTSGTTSGTTEKITEKTTEKTTASTSTIKPQEPSNSGSDDSFDPAEIVG